MHVHEVCYYTIQAVTEQQMKVHEANMEHQMNMLETKMKAFQQALWKEIRADTEEQVREVKERVSEKIKETIPQCAVVKEMRGDNNYIIISSCNTIQCYCNAFFSSPLQYITSL